VLALHELPAPRQQLFAVPTPQDPTAADPHQLAGRHSQPVGLHLQHLLLPLMQQLLGLLAKHLDPMPEQLLLLTQRPPAQQSTQVQVLMSGCYGNIRNAAEHSDVWCTRSFCYACASAGQRTSSNSSRSARMSSTGLSAMGFGLPWIQGQPLAS
jgi:hypothetical protein